MNKPLKILIFNWQDKTHPLAGGAEIYLHEIFSRMARNHQVTLFCCSYEGAKGEEIIDGIKIIRRGKRNLSNFTSFWWYLVSGRKQKYDVVVEFANKAPYLSPLWIFRPKRVVAQMHFNGSTFLLEKPILGKILFSIEKMLFWFYKREQFVVISESTREDMKNYHLPNEKAEVVYPGILTGSVGRKEKTEFPSVLCVSRLKKYKSVDLLIRAFAKVLQKLPNAKLLLAGSGNQKEELEKLASDLEILGSINFLGKVSEEEKFDLYASAWVNVLPSQKEGWGMTVLEAARMGTTSIASRVSGLRETMEDGKSGILIEYGDEAALVSAIIKILSDENLRSLFEKGAFSYSENFSWENSAKKFEDFLVKYCCYGKKALAEGKSAEKTALSSGF